MLIKVYHTVNMNTYLDFNFITLFLQIHIALLKLSFMRLQSFIGSDTKHTILILKDIWQE